MIFWISIQNWVDLSDFFNFSVDFFFNEKKPLVPPRVRSKNESRRKVVSTGEMRFWGCEMTVEPKITDVEIIKTLFWRDSFFNRTLGGGVEAYFSMKKKWTEKFKNHIHIYSVLDADSEYHYSFYSNRTLSGENLPKISEKQLKSRTGNSIT